MNKKTIIWCCAYFALALGTMMYSDRLTGWMQHEIILVGGVFLGVFACYFAMLLDNLKQKKRTGGAKDA